MSANGSAEPESPTLAIVQLRNEIDHSNYEVKRDGNDYFDLYMRAQEETKQVKNEQVISRRSGVRISVSLLFLNRIFLAYDGIRRKENGTY